MSKNTKNNQDDFRSQGTVRGPNDFYEGGLVYRRNILASTSLTFVLIMSKSHCPELIGVKVPEYVMWGSLGIAHLYFFLMWRLTSIIEGDKGNKFFNWGGLKKQAFARGTKGLPGKMKAQFLLIRSLPIWAFVVGLFGIACGLCSSLFTQQLISAC